jgi:hypothetical protein
MALETSQKHILQQTYSIINEISKLAGLSSIEIMMTVIGYKPAMADAIFFDKELKKNMGKIKDYAQQIGLYLATSKYKYIVNSPLGIFEEIPLDDPRDAKIILAFAKTKIKAQKGADYYHAKMVDGKYGYKFGKLMGYPKCCLKFGNYLQNLKGDPNNFGFKNPAVESLKRSKHFAWQLNVFTVSLLPHYPCSLTCKKSIAYVDKVFACLDYIDKERSIFLKNYLTEPASLYWTCADRILLYGDFKQYTLGTGEIKYNKIEPIITSDTFYQEVNKKDIVQWRNIAKALQKGNKLIVTDYSCSIYFNEEKLFETKKDNKYTPVLVKPDILSSYE